jgi:hypothetical protein
MGFLARKERQELTPQAVDRITNVVRGLADDQVDRGVDLNRQMHCDSCGRDTSPNGSALYGTYKLCNDCLLDFTLKLASGEVDSVAEYMTKRDDNPTPTDLESPRVDRSVSYQSLPGRDKLMPSHEPS